MYKSSRKPIISSYFSVMSIHVAKLLQLTYISMLNGTFQSIFHHVTTYNYFIIKKVFLHCPNKRQFVWDIFAKGIFFYDYDLQYASIWTFCVDILGYWATESVYQWQDYRHLHPFIDIIIFSNRMSNMAILSA